MKTTSNEIFNTEDVIDSRDVIDRIEFLQDEYDSLKTDVSEGDIGVEAKDALDEWESDYKNELDSLIKLADQGETISDWPHGVTLINEDYFTQYAEEMVKDIGDMPRKIPEYIEIDWEKTAANLLVDYTNLDFGGKTYYAR